MSEIQQKDLVLNPNQYSYVLDKTKGNISCWVGPCKTSLSTSDALVRFNERTKEFETCDYDHALNLFCCAPENWYIILKNPVDGDKHPTAGTANTTPETMSIGKKVNIRGPVSFALYPGQMAKVIRGHALRTNQYLLARVYEADAANHNQGEVIDANGNKVENTVTNCVNGQILVIKGTEISFYIPPTGIEVIPIENNPQKGYVREAVTLERLEYCILKDENGNKRYVHGPEVVFPKPTETFVTSPKGGVVFKAIELSKISGIYVKVIAEYTDEKKVRHPVGEEMFITGADQMIYYPRPEHAIINYDNKVMHHAIAIPEGEGRYIMDRLTGEIKTIKGPAMYLPDPRTEVVVRRKLTPNQCHLWYPGNGDVLAYNEGLSEKSVEKSLRTNNKSISADSFWNTVSANNCSYLNETVTTLSDIEASASVSRGTSYTKPRTITLDNKYEGVVSVDVWTGYAVDVISKNGERKVVCGPQTILLDYDQTLEALELSTGRPKNTDHTIKTVYLRHENNKVTDIIDVETKDFVKATVKISYCVNFDKKLQDKWFNIDNYVKYLCDRERSLIKKYVKNYTIDEFYQNYSSIVHDIAVDNIDNGEQGDTDRPCGRYFEENGMYVYDAEVLNLNVQSDIEELLTEHQYEMVKKNLELADAEKNVQIAEALIEAEKKEQELRYDKTVNKLELQKLESEKKIAMQAELNRAQEAERVAAKQAEADLQVLIDKVHEANLAREQAEADQRQKNAEAAAALEKQKQDAYAETVSKIMASIGPDLVAAMTTKSNEDMLSAVTEAMAPYSIAKGESIAQTVNTLLRGTSLEGILEDVNINV